jgi:NAD-dependent deacetylase
MNLHLKKLKNFNSRSDEIEALKARLEKTRSIVILTGAGISAASGVPTFRGKNGLFQGIKPETLATLEAFLHNPSLVWKWYNWRRKIISQAKPNPAHFALSKLEQKIKQTTIITQNVDGLHKKAKNKNLIEIHGNIWQVKCIKCPYNNEDLRVPIPLLPKCPECNEILRPDVVWFGEEPKHLSKVMEKLNSCEVFLSIGTSGIVQPAASFFSIAKDHGAYTVEINLEPTPLSPFFDLLILGRAEQIIPSLL